MDESLYFLIFWINFVSESKKLSWELAAEIVIELANVVIREHNDSIMYSRHPDTAGWFDNQIAFYIHLNDRVYKEIDAPLLMRKGKIVS